MRSIKVITFAVLVLFCLINVTYGECQIQFDAEADRVLHLGGDTLRGNFATKQECIDYWKSRPAFERNHSKCVGCKDKDPSQQENLTTLKSRRPSRFRRPSQTESITTHRTTAEDYKKEQQIKQEEFNNNKTEMLGKLKGSGNSGLQLKGGESKLALKTGNIPVHNNESSNKAELLKAEQRLNELRADVKRMQQALKLYQEALMNNVSILDKQADEITARNNKLLYDGVKYILSVSSDKFLKSKSTSKFTKDQIKKYKELMDVIEELKSIKKKGKLTLWLINKPNDNKKLIEGIEMLAEMGEDKIEGVLDKFPIWQHIKMNYKAWTGVGKVRSSPRIFRLKYT